MRLLLVEDDRMLGRSVQEGLRRLGHTVDWVFDARSALRAALDEPYDIVLLDLGLPDGSGLEVLTEIRARRLQVPVLIVTARDAVGERIRGLDAGADDYLTKPFDLDELAARIRALGRRAAGRAEPLIEIGDLSIDPAAAEVRVGGMPVRLSPREYALLVALAERPGIPMSRAQLEQRVYGWGEEVESNAVEVHVHGLRRKLGAGRIRTLRGVGYLIPKPD
ncbi:MAG: response regulator [Burkholderiales bacterium]|nr:MAG: response regulator [Burkholderiales bacterium]